MRVVIYFCLLCLVDSVNAQTGYVMQEGVAGIGAAVGLFALFSDIIYLFKE